jgi:hypothetical protein
MPSRRERITSFFASILLCTCLACSLSLIARDFTKPFEQSGRFNLPKTAGISRLVKSGAERPAGRDAQHPANLKPSISNRRRSVESYFVKSSSVRLTSRNSSDVGPDEQLRQGRKQVVFSVILLLGTSASILAVIAATGLILAERSKRHKRLLLSSDCDTEDEPNLDETTHDLELNDSRAKLPEAYTDPSSGDHHEEEKPLLRS